MVQFQPFTYRTQNLPVDLESFQNVLLPLLRRNAALQLAPCQPDWDLLLPVYTGDINKPLERDHLSAIFIQTRNREHHEKLTLGTEYRMVFRPEQLGFCLQMEFGADWRRPLAYMRWPSSKRDRDGAIRTSGPFVFGMQVFGADDRTFPFLAKYPELCKACRNLLDTLQPCIQYPNELRHLEDFLGYNDDSTGPSR
jgi:hypothetical protein